MMVSPMHSKKSQFSVPREHYHALWFGLTRNREVLYERINQRVDLMFEQGLVDEVRGLMGQGAGRCPDVDAGNWL